MRSSPGTVSQQSWRRSRGAEHLLAALSSLCVQLITNHFSWVEVGDWVRPGDLTQHSSLSFWLRYHYKDWRCVWGQCPVEKQMTVPLSTNQMWWHGLMSIQYVSPNTSLLLVPPQLWLLCSNSTMKAWLWFMQSPLLLWRCVCYLNSVKHFFMDKNHGQTRLINVLNCVPTLTLHNTTDGLKHKLTWQGAAVHWKLFQVTISWIWLAKCQKWEKLSSQQNVATLKNIKYKTFWGFLYPLLIGIWRYDRKQDKREGEWHAAKGPRPGRCSEDKACLYPLS